MRAGHRGPLATMASGRRDHSHTAVRKIRSTKRVHVPFAEDQAIQHGQKAVHYP